MTDDLLFEQLPLLSPRLAVPPCTSPLQLPLRPVHHRTNLLLWPFLLQTILRGALCGLHLVYTFLIASLRILRILRRHKISRRENSDFPSLPSLLSLPWQVRQELPIRRRERREGASWSVLVRELYSSGDSQQRIVDHLIACFALLYCTVLYCTVAVHYQVLLSSKNSFNIICTEWWGVQMDTTPSNSLETQIITKMHFILSTWLERSTVTPYWTFHHFDCFDQTIHYWNSI